jgi:type IV secretion system protein VirB8
MTDDIGLERYFEEAASWDADRIAGAERASRIAWRVAAVGWFFSFGCMASLILLMPLKRVEPFVIRVDGSSGIVDVVPAYTGGASIDESVTRYFLSHYVIVCERFNFASAESDYEECGAFHSAQRNQAWYAQWTPSNPASPINVHKDGSTMRAQVESVSFLQRARGESDTAQVRYLKAERQAGAAQERLSHWIATIQYAYSEVPKDPRVRRWNPLGFKIVEFRTEPEALSDSRSGSTVGGKGGSS